LGETRFLAEQDGIAARRRRRSSEEVSDRILDAAAEEFEQAGYSGATTAAIARRAEVTEAQIFRLFGSKRELFHAAIFAPLNRHFQEFHARTAADATPPSEALALSYIGELQDFIEQHSRMLMSLIVASAYSPGDTGGVGEMEGLRAYFERGAAMMTERGASGGRVDPALMVRVSFAAVLANVMFRDWLFPKSMDQETIRRAIGDFIVHGIEVPLSKA
jgi:AcrR family transcriptional regulator